MAVRQCSRFPRSPACNSRSQNYAGKVRTLAIVWFIFAGFYLLRGVAALTFARAFFSGHFGPWFHGPWARAPSRPEFFAGMLGLVWATLAVKTALALVAAWGLLEHEQWGRIVAIVAAFLFLINIPFGTALGIWTLVMLLGYKNSTLYEQL